MAFAIIRAPTIRVLAMAPYKDMPMHAPHYRDY